MKLITALGFVALLLSGCEGCPNGSIDDCRPAQEAELRARHPFSQTTVYHDDQRKVTCWRVQYQPGGMSCLPDWMLNDSKVTP